jgi:cation diffusion facilitator family transporter
MATSNAATMKIEERLLEVSIVLLVVIGLIEVLVGYYTKSIALLADGVHSWADTIVSSLVFVGIKLSRRGPDGKFNHGYGRAETVFGLIAAMVVVAIGAVLMYESYLAFLEPSPLMYPNLAIAAVFLAGVISLAIAFFKIRLARKASSTALSVDAYNSLKDGAASFIVLIALVLASFGYLFFDALGGFIVSVMILIIAYISIKESSIVLMDGCICGDIYEDIYSKAEAVPNVKHLRNLKLRQVGRAINVEATVELDGQLSINQAEDITLAIKNTILEAHPEISKIILETAAVKEKQV